MKSRFIGLFVRRPAGWSPPKSGSPRQSGANSGANFRPGVTPSSVSSPPFGGQRREGSLPSPGVSGMPMGVDSNQMWRLARHRKPCRFGTMREGPLGVRAARWPTSDSVSAVRRFTAPVRQSHLATRHASASWMRTCGGQRTNQHPTRSERQKSLPALPSRYPKGERLLFLFA
jgi:hypothetical protein